MENEIMKRLWTIVSIALIASLLTVVPLTFLPSPVVAAAEERTVTFEWYSFFDVPMVEEVWLRREEMYGIDHVISWNYPVVYIWGKLNAEPTQYYTSARLKVTARNLPEINIDKIGGVNSPEYPTEETGFLPCNLTGGLEAGVTGGTANLTNWYLQYLGEERAAKFDVTGAWWDGWVCELNGTITMDKNATRKVLGITDAQYADIISWWATKETDVEDAWIDWLMLEGGSDGRVDIRAFFEWPFGAFALNLTLLHADNNKTILTIDVVNYGMECLLARWFQETFMPGYEGWYSDLHLNATIGSETTDLDLDTAVDWALYIWNAEDVPYAEGVWSWEPLLGDLPTEAYKHQLTTSPAYPYYGKTYDDQEYDYVPAAWNLTEGETLKFSFKDTDENGPVWVLTEMPDGTVINNTGFLWSGYMEPWGNTTESYSEKISYDPETKTLTLTGPIDAETWLKSAYPEEFDRLDGLLPWGCPYVEFKVGTAVSISPSNISGPPPDVDEQFTVDITVSTDSDIWSWQAGMSFNATVLQCISVEEGPFLATGGTTAWVPGEIRNTEGTITPYSCELTAGTPVNGTGILATVTFEVTGYGTSYLNLTDVKLLDSDLAEISTDLIRYAKVTVTAPPPSGLPIELIIGVVVVVVVVIVVVAYVVVRRKKTA